MQNRSNHIKTVLLLSGVIFLSLLVYTPIINGNFVNWDDEMYILENQLITDFTPSGIVNIFSTYYALNYQPLTLLSYATEYKLFQFNAAAYHINNLLLHLINTILTFIFIFILLSNIIGTTKYKPHIHSIALLCALLFGIHTFHVEAVAWISLRKTLLYVFFYLLGLICYLYYLIQKTYSTKTIAFSLSLVFLILSLLSKGLAISFPITIIAIDILFERKTLSKKVIFEKAPFIFVSLFFVLIGFYAIQSEEYDNSVQNYPIYKRFLFACFAYIQYIFKLIAPINLSITYFYPKNFNIIPIKYFIYIFPVISIIISFFYSVKKNKLLAFIILFFTSTIVISLQLIPYHSFIMADRYSYMPSIAFFLLIGISLNLLNNKHILIQYSFYLLFLFYTIFLSTYTINRCKIWKNSYSLWTEVLSNNPTHLTATNNLGLYKKNHGDFEGAYKEFKKTISIDSNYVFGYINCGNVEFSKNKYNKAIEYYNIAIQLDSNNLKTFENRGISNFMINNIYSAEKDITFAIENEKTAIKKSDYLYTRAMMYYRQNKLEKSCSDLYIAIQLGNKKAFKLYNKVCSNK